MVIRLMAILSWKRSEYQGYLRLVCTKYTVGMWRCWEIQVYGTVAEGPMRGVPITGCLGDQHAAALGQVTHKLIYMLHRTTSMLTQTAESILSDVADSELLSATEISGTDWTS